MTDLKNFSPEFINALRSQDKAAFNLLVQKAHYRLSGFATSLVGVELAEDTMQDAWVAVWRGLPKFENRASLMTWLYTIIRNECTSRLKRERRDAGVIKKASVEVGAEDWLDSHFNENGQWSDPPAVWDIDTPESALEGSQLAACLEKQIAKLHPTQQAVFRLRDIEKLEFEEICNILDLSHSNVRVLLHRARLNLLQVIDHYQKTGNC